MRTSCHWTGPSRLLWGVRVRSVRVSVSRRQPAVSESDVTWLPHVKHRKFILALEVRCSMKDRGCEWTGVLQDLDAHLDVNTGDCQFVDVQCHNKCRNERCQTTWRTPAPNETITVTIVALPAVTRWCVMSTTHSVTPTPSPAPTAAQLCPSNEALWTCT